MRIKRQPCRGGCGTIIKRGGWNRDTITYQRRGICRKCARKIKVAAMVRKSARRQHTQKTDREVTQ